MHEPNQEKTTFITPRGVFCYKFMPFGLKNAGAIYRRVIMKMFESILGKTMNTYINDMVVKSKEKLDYIRDLTKVFAILKTHKIETERSKVCLRGELGKVLGTFGDKAKQTQNKSQ